MTAKEQRDHWRRCWPELMKFKREVEARWRTDSAGCIYEHAVKLEEEQRS